MNKNLTKRRVLFICTHNSARSQMAQGLLTAVAGDRFEVESAGTEATSVRPEAVEAMRLRHIDITRQTSKTLDRFLDQPWDYVITVCDHANEACPLFPGGQHRLHWSFPDPSSFQGSPQERQLEFDRIAGQTEVRITDWLRDLGPA